VSGHCPATARNEGRRANGHQAPRRMNLRFDQHAAKPNAESVPVTVPAEAPTLSGAPFEEKAEPEKRRANLRPLASLLPYVKRYRGRALAALGALTLAALTTLIVPVAVRRMIDFGFTAHGVHLINSYFLAMIAVAAV